jgi:hypothetical protein
MICAISRMPQGMPGTKGFSYAGNESVKRIDWRKFTLSPLIYALVVASHGRAILQSADLELDRSLNTEQHCRSA